MGSRKVVEFDPKNCKAFQQSDQMYCPRCHFVWDMNDPDPPRCYTSIEVDQARLKRIKDTL